MQLTPKSTRRRKLPKATVEVIADAFMAAFVALPGAIQWRIVQKIEEREDEIAEAQLAAERAANPDDFHPKYSVPLEQVIVEMEAKRKRKKGQPK